MTPGRRCTGRGADRSSESCPTCRPSSRPGGGCRRLRQPSPAKSDRIAATRYLIVLTPPCGVGEGPRSVPFIRHSRAGRRPVCGAVRRLRAGPAQSNCLPGTELQPQGRSRRSGWWHGRQFSVKRVCGASTSPNPIGTGTTRCGSRRSIGRSRCADSPCRMQVEARSLAPVVVLPSTPIYPVAVGTGIQRGKSIMRWSPPRIHRRVRRCSI